MPHSKPSLFSDFPPISKEEWLSKMEKDLKGKPLDTLKWMLGEDLDIDPAYTLDDEIRNNVIASETGNDWEIGAYISFGDTKIGNEKALEALKGGAEALLFLIEEPFSNKEYKSLFKNIHLEYISSHFSFRGGFDIQEAFLDSLDNTTDTEGRDNIKGSFDVDILRDELHPDFEGLTRFLSKTKKLFPSIQCLNIDGGACYNGKENVVEELAQLLWKLEQYARGLEKEGMLVNDWGPQCFFSIAVDTSFFINIAKIRALKLLVVEWQKAYGISPQLPTIEAHFAPMAYSEDQYTNMIKATSMGMSAIFAGVKRLFVLPSNAGTEEDGTVFQNRIARNVQHLFKMESNLDLVGDPASGSYYVEQITQTLAKKAWSRFQDLAK